MRFAEVSDLWGADIHQLSRLDQGRLYVERAKIVLSTDPVVWKRRGRKLDRLWLSRQIGCARSALTQNPQLRSLIEYAERGQSIGSVRASNSSEDLGNGPANIGMQRALDRLLRFARANSQ